MDINKMTKDELQELEKNIRSQAFLGPEEIALLGQIKKNAHRYKS